MSTSKKSAPAAAAQIYQFEIVMHYIDPPIWRRFQVRDSTTLGTLHEIVQVVIGWEDEHMHEFVHGNIHYGMPDPELHLRDEDKATLRSLGMKVGDVLGYVYDFGDDWRHDLLLEEVLPPVPGAKYPVCLEGERACPPEDCGSVPGYENILRILALPPRKRTEEDLDMLEWLGDGYDPEFFDLEGVNSHLAQFSKPRMTRG